MGTIESSVNPDNTDIITIDISAISDTQRNYLKKCINYQDLIADPSHPGSTMANPVPLIAALLMDSMKQRIQQIKEIISAEGSDYALSTAASVLSDLL